MRAKASYKNIGIDISEMDISEGALISWVGSAEAGLAGAAGAQALAALVRRYRPDLMPPSAPHNAVYQVLQHEFGNKLCNVVGI